MPVPKNITVLVNNSIGKIKDDLDPLSSTQDYDINIRVADGWAITGHYQNNSLQTITIEKSTVMEAK